ncbi:maleylpyruvate isomerase family mycothiol-dependent enzyme [Sphaerisporangium sp. TRM90804]|uniref:maleylpyruvate isomerase family mycothiol-dependent enzyme n=1 Tax=Sphaerisporangium sp. TRM90804 TaxID=3031113 RepID=UPI002448220C|nr:maleylpyruvate isomerase family mycothiol-dependent enzyme [Sphaerisporangium sp. TRM90804]MDH2430287.1 maleylpyruvate isomerase family mycothiol-dependent enzyme [Sphaerisporangium sp. TRM90804]
MTALDDLQAELSAATNRLLATAATLSDRDIAAPSLLPGWTLGHVLVHVARNGDSLLNLLTWAKTGVYTPQYPTAEARDAEIAEGAGRSAKEQHADLADGAARFDDYALRMPPEAWAATVSGLRPPEHPAWYVLARRIREVEIHHSDLGVGYTWADWPEGFVRRELHDALVTWPHERSRVGAVRALGRVWTGLGEGPLVDGPDRTLLAWVCGRLGAGEGEAGGLVVRDAGSGDHPSEEGPRLAGEPPAAPPWLTISAPRGLPATPPEEYPCLTPVT